MPELLINIKIDTVTKFDLFKVTFAQIIDCFDVCHIKFRGHFDVQCLKFVESNAKGDIFFYQSLPTEDWVFSTIKMLDNVKCRSVFLYFEDHMLVETKNPLKSVLADFDKYNLDYLGYSFFRASRLGVNNILPLSPTQHKYFHTFDLTGQNLKTIKKISGPGDYYTYSLLSVNSVKYLYSILQAENKKVKIYSKILNYAFFRVFSYPGYRRVYLSINNILSKINTRICFYPPASPFNLEKVWFENVPKGNISWKFGILKEELFANFDDDNGAHGESLIKRGLYPITPNLPSQDDVKGLNDISQNIMLESDQTLDCAYYSMIDRINRSPIVQVKVLSGEITACYKDYLIHLKAGDNCYFYSNLGLSIKALEASKVNIITFDEIF